MGRVRAPPPRAHPRRPLPAGTDPARPARQDRGHAPPKLPAAKLPTARNRALRHRAQPTADARQGTQRHHLLRLLLPHAYGDTAAEALGHGKWQYIREDNLQPIIDRFFATDIFGPQRIHHFRAQHAALAPTLRDKETAQRKRLTAKLADLDQRLERQLAAIESGVDPLFVGKRIRTLKDERQQAETALAQLDLQQRERTGIDLDEACAVLEALPDLSKPLAKADPELRRHVYDAFQLAVELDRNTPQVRLKALVSSAFTTASDLDSLAGEVANGAIAGAGFEPATFGL